MDKPAALYNSMPRPSRLRSLAAAPGAAGSGFLISIGKRLFPSPPGMTGPLRSPAGPKPISGAPPAAVSRPSPEFLGCTGAAASCEQSRHTRGASFFPVTGCRLRGRLSISPPPPLNGGKGVTISRPPKSPGESSGHIRTAEISAASRPTDAISALPRNRSARPECFRIVLKMQPDKVPHLAHAHTSAPLHKLTNYFLVGGPQCALRSSRTLTKDRHRNLKSVPGLMQPRHPNNRD